MQYQGAEHLLVQPGLDGGGPLSSALREPQADLVLSGLNGVRAVDDVAANLNGEVTADGAGLRGQRVGGTDQLAAGGDDTL